MNKNFRSFIAAGLFIAASSPVFAQKSGVITYEVTARMDPERMRGFNRGGNDDNNSVPDVVTFNQTFTFNDNVGKITTERPDFGGQRRQQRPDGDTSRRRGPGGPGGPGGQGGRMMMGPGGNAQYVDLANKKYEQVFSTFGDDKKVFYTEEDYIYTANSKSSDKTKKIAGYTCKRATIQLKDDTYTVWYTTDLPFSFSPVNGLLPENNAVVLAAESSRRAFTAKSVDLKPVTEDLSIPAGAEKISQEKMREIRREQMEKLRERQQ
ncbi:GLPGLI family protein [Chitinophaga silvatica]|nr:GLPGLI family protein [Chitinophaga silvatica]